LSESISQRSKGYLTRILDSSKWLLHIINDILDLTSFESGKIDLVETAFDVYEVIDECTTMFIPKATENGLMLNFYSDPSVKSNLIGDPARLRQVLINLLSNAVKFTSSGVIEFQMDVREINGDNATLYFEVADSGIGITPEQMEIIFEPFTQADSGITRKYGGTGLGLTITKNIIEHMGGAINVESTPGVGSTFSFELTFKLEKTETPTNTQLALSSNKKPVFQGDVLLCEDNIMNQQVACDFLAKVGLNTTVAENGRIGVELAKEKKFDLILMDIHMPIMDGIEATEQILAHDPTVPIVAMTANIMTADVEVYIKTGMKECLGKPFVSQELWNCLLRYLKPVGWNDDRVLQEADN